MYTALEVSVSGVWIATVPVLTQADAVEFRNALTEAGFEVKLALGEAKQKAA